MDRLATAVEHGFALTYIPFTFADPHPHHNPRAHRLLVTYVHLFEDCWNQRGSEAPDCDLRRVAERVRAGKAPTETHNHPVVICPDCVDRWVSAESGENA